jgi:hypothetical protein
MPGLIMRNALGPIKLGQSSFDFGQKYEAFNGIVDGGIGRHRLEGLNNAVASKWLLHGSVVNKFRGRRNYTLTIRKSVVLPAPWGPTCPSSHG